MADDMRSALPITDWWMCDWAAMTTAPWTVANWTLESNVHELEPRADGPSRGPEAARSSGESTSRRVLDTNGGRGQTVPSRSLQLDQPRTSRPSLGVEGGGAGWPRPQAQDGAPAARLDWWTDWPSSSRQFDELEQPQSSQQP